MNNSFENVVWFFWGSIIEQLSKIHTEINTLKKEDNNKGALFYFVFFFRKVLNEFEIKFDLDDNTSLLATPLALALNYAIQKINGITLNDYTVEEVSNLVSKVLFEKKKNFLLSFDKYDDFIDTTVESLRKSEINLYDFHHEMIIQTLLKSLMLAAKEIKKNESYTWIHLLVTIPFDKFIELRFREKLAMDEHITYLRWSPLDLYKFITYRIGSALNLNMNETLGIWYNIFPKDIPNGLFKNRLEDTFLYLIRHSLWRPREILKYVQNIVKEAIVMIEEKKYDNTFLFSSEEWAAIFNKAISETSVYLISSEFIPEYQVQYPNIQEVLNTIKHSPKSKTILPKHQWINILKDTTLSSQITNPEDILIRLYQMGVVGVRTQVPSHRQSTEFSPIIVQYNINYMYTFGLYEIELNPFSKNVDVVVNPLFYDYLELEHNAKDNSQEIIPCQLTWKSMAIDITDEIHDFIGE